MPPAQMLKSLYGDCGIGAESVGPTFSAAISALMRTMRSRGRYLCHRAHHAVSDGASIFTSDTWK